MSTNLVRFGGIAGVIFAVLIAVGAFAVGGSPPEISATGKDILGYYTSSNARLSYVAGAALPTVFAALFFSTLTLRLWAREADRGWTLFAFSSAIITGAVATASGILVWGPLTYGHVDETTAQALNAAQQTSEVGIGLLVLTILIAYGVVQYRVGSLTRWLGYLAFLTAVFEAIAFIASFTDGSPGMLGLPGLLGFLLWTLLTGALQATGRTEPTKA